MAKIQDVDIPYLEFAEAAAPSTPASGIVRTYSKSDGLMYSKDDAGTETLMSGGGSGIGASIFDAKGDLIVASAADTAARQAVGANGTVLVARSGEANGVKWEPPPGSLIALTAFGTSGSYTTTTTLADMDATNLLVTFTVPASGNVLIRLTCQAFNTTTTSVLVWGLRESTTTIQAHQIASSEGLAANKVDTFSRTFYVSGLTPGDSKTYKWAAKHATNSWTMRWENAADSFGWATMEVIAAP